MIKTNLLYTFNSPYIAAASGLTIVHDTFYVVSDDELSLLKLSADLKTCSRLTLFPGELPLEHKARKKEKPDLEAVVYLEKMQSVLCLPSGSKPNRTKGVLVDLDDHVKMISFSETYQKLSQSINDLNIEGAVIKDQEIILLQRGNGKDHFNAFIALNLQEFLNDQTESHSITQVDLGNLHGVPLSFTDGLYHNGEILFLAVAENTASTYLDGEFAGAVLGIWDGFKIRDLREIAMTSKPEGLAMKDGVLYVVTDDDDRTKPSKLLRVFY